VRADTVAARAKTVAVAARVKTVAMRANTVAATGGWAQEEGSDPRVQWGSGQMRELTQLQ